MRVEIKKLKARDHILVFDEKNRIQHIEPLRDKKLISKGKNFILDKLVQFNAVKDYLKSNGHSEEEATQITSEYIVDRFKTIIDKIPVNEQNTSEKNVEQKEIIKSFFNMPLFSDG
jgi:hypothetical protein